MQEAIAAMSTARAGACVVTDEGGNLAGIFTHGDFARAYESDAGVGARPVRDFMTADPITVPAGHLAAEAVKAIGEKGSTTWWSRMKTASRLGSSIPRTSPG